jgi:type IV secretion system protein VirB10
LCAFCNALDVLIEVPFMLPRLGFIAAATAAIALAQAPQPAAALADVPAEQPHSYFVEPGTRILLGLINSVSTKNAAEGDRVYLETAFPVLVDGRLVIPTGSYVTGTVTQVKRAGKVKGRSALFIRFDSLTLANGVTRDFRARPSTLDGDQRGSLDRSEGKIKGDSDKLGDATKVATGASYGAMIGGVASGATGAGIGAGAGAVAGLIGVLMSRGPETVLARGSTMEMVLDRQLQFQEDEVPAVTSTPRQPIQPARQPDASHSKAKSWPAGPRP